jgi:hypothetical protein
MKFIIELEIWLFFPLKSALSKLKTDRNTKIIGVGGPSNSTALPTPHRDPAAEPEADAGQPEPRAQRSARRCM